MASASRARRIFLALRIRGKRPRRWPAGWSPASRGQARTIEAVARSLTVQIHPVEVKGSAELDGAFATIFRERADGLLFIADPVFFISLKRIADFVTSRRLPAIANFTEFPKLGGLMGYAPSIPDEFRHAAGHVDKILKGAKPADLPVEQPNEGAHWSCPGARAASTRPSSMPPVA
jgi:putative ABC transport system substrate-binding protein